MIHRHIYTDSCPRYGGQAEKMVGEEGFLAGAWAHSHPAAVTLLIKQELAGGGNSVRSQGNCRAEWDSKWSRLQSSEKVDGSFSVSFPFLIFSETFFSSYISSTSNYWTLYPVHISVLGLTQGNFKKHCCRKVKPFVVWMNGWMTRWIRLWTCCYESLPFCWQTVLC